MLVLSVSKGEIVVAGNIIVHFLGRKDGSSRFRLGFEAPPEVTITRGSLLTFEQIAEVERVIREARQ